MGGLATALSLGGCSVETAALPEPRMPTMGAVAAPPVPLLAADAAREQATVAVNAGNFSNVSAILQRTEPTARDGVVRTLIEDLEQNDLARAERLAEALTSQSLQRTAVDTLARAQVARDTARGTSWALGLSTPIASGARQVVAERLVESGPAPALSRLLSLPDSPARNEMLTYAVAAWTRRAPAAATAWVRDLHAGPEKNHLAVSLGFALAQTDPAQAVALLETLPEGRDRMAVMGAIGQTWVARDANKAWLWANQLPAGPSREAALAGIETGLGGAGSGAARDDLRLAGRGAGGATRGGAPALIGVQRDDAVRDQFNQAMQASPARAADWLTMLPTPDRRDEMVDELVRRWAPLNPSATKTWIEQNITNPARRDQLLRDTERIGGY